MTLSEWAQVEAAITAAWSNARTMDKNQVRVRHQICTDLSLGDALAAVTQMARADREFPPNPGQIYAAVSAAHRPPAPAPGAVLALLRQALGRFSTHPSLPAERLRENEAAAIRWLADKSPHAARFAVEHGLRQFAREHLDDPKHGGAVRQRLERSITASTAGLEREHREGRVLPLVQDHVARLEAGFTPRTGLRHTNPLAALVAPPTRQLPEETA